MQEDESESAGETEREDRQGEAARDIRIYILSPCNRGARCVAIEGRGVAAIEDSGVSRSRIAVCHARGSRCVTIEDRGSRCVTLEDRGVSRLRIEDRGVSRSRISVCHD